MFKKHQDAQRDWVAENQINGIERFMSNVPIKSTTKFLDLAKPEDTHLVNDMMHYINYSLTIFGWPFYAYEGSHNLCLMLPYMRLSGCCTGFRNRNKSHMKTKSKVNNGNNTDSNVDNLDDWNEYPIVIGDGFTGCNQAAARRRLRNNNHDIIYINYKSDYHIVPFMVAVDHAKQSIIVSIRGSMALSDAVIDFNGHTDQIPGCPEGWFAHRGMLKSALYIQSTLTKSRVLEQAFEFKPELGTRKYQLTFCGHSLGAGISALLGLLYYDKYPDLKAYLFSPPGGLFSKPAVEFSKKFATGIFLGNDCVPRAGIVQIERLIYNVFSCLKINERSKANIVAGALCPKLCCTRSQDSLEYDPDRSPDILFGKNETEAFKFKGKSVVCPVTGDTLYVPGRLIHIVRDYPDTKSGSRRNSNVEPLYQAIWADNYDFDRLVVDDCMFSDHLPTNLRTAMKMLFSKSLPRIKQDSSSNIRESENIREKADTDNVDTNHLIKMKAVIEANHFDKDENNNNNNSEDFEDQNNNNNNNSNYPDFNYPFLNHEVAYPDLNGNDSNVKNQN